MRNKFLSIERLSEITEFLQGLGEWPSVHDVEEALFVALLDLNSLTSAVLLRLLAAVCVESAREVGQPERSADGNGTAKHLWQCSNYKHSISTSSTK